MDRDGVGLSNRPIVPNRFEFRLPVAAGNLDLHGVKKSVSFPAEIQASPKALSVKAEFAINRRDFNINYPGMPNDLIRDQVVLKLDIKATPGPARPEDQIPI